MAMVLFYLYNFAISEMLYKWNHTVYNLLSWHFSLSAVLGRFVSVHKEFVPCLLRSGISQYDVHSPAFLLDLSLLGFRLVGNTSGHTHFSSPQSSQKVCCFHQKYCIWGKKSPWKSSSQSLEIRNSKVLLFSNNEIIKEKISSQEIRLLKCLNFPTIVEIRGCLSRSLMLMQNFLQNSWTKNLAMGTFHESILGFAFSARISLPFLQWESQDLSKTPSTPSVRGYEGSCDWQMDMGPWRSYGSSFRLVLIIHEAKNSSDAAAEHLALKWVNEIFISGHLTLPSTSLESLPIWVDPPIFFFWIIFSLGKWEITLYLAVREGCSPFVLWDKNLTISTLAM